MDRRSYETHSARSADFVGRPPPSDDETIWIDDDYVLDLMFALCDLLYVDGCHGSSYLLERAIDLFLFEIGRTASPKWRTRQGGGEVPSEEVSNIFEGTINASTTSKRMRRSRPGPTKKIFQSRRFARAVPASTADEQKDEISSGLSPTHDEDRPRFRRLDPHMGHGRTVEPGDTRVMASESLFGIGSCPYTIHVSLADENVIRFQQPLQRVARDGSIRE